MRRLGAPESLSGTPEVDFSLPTPCRTATYVVPATLSLETLANAKHPGYTPLQVTPAPAPAPAIPALPPLPEEDATLLTRLIELGENLYALAKETQRPVLDLFSWRSRPDIAAYLTAHRELAAHLLHQEALAALQALMRATGDPIERRRTASAILRGLKDPATLRPAPSRSTPAAISDDDPEDDDLDDDDPFDPAPLLATRVPLPPRPPDPTIPEHFAPKPGDVPCPEGLPLPDPSRQPSEVFALVMEALRRPDTPAKGAVCHLIYNLQAVNQPRRPFYIDHIAMMIREHIPLALAHSEAQPIGEPDITTGVAVQHYRVFKDGRTATIKLVLFRQAYGTFKDCWLLHEYSTG